MSRTSAALLLIRIASAMAFLYHGSGILFGAFGGPGPEKFAGMLHSPVVVSYLVGLGEVLGGLGILLGVLARIAAASMAVIMGGAIVLVHLPHGFDIAQGGYEYALTQLLIAVAIVLAGPGEYSLGAQLSPGWQKLR
jgi:putative oxidoreductase